jgi:hypothetical protein
MLTHLSVGYFNNFNQYYVQRLVDFMYMLCFAHVFCLTDIKLMERQELSETDIYLLFI